MGLLRQEFVLRSSSRAELARAPTQWRGLDVVTAHQGGHGERAVRYRSCPVLLDRSFAPSRPGVRIGDDRGIEIGDAFLVMSPIHVVLIHLGVQITQQVAFAIFAGMGLFKCGSDSPVLAILPE